MPPKFSFILKSLALALLLSLVGLVLTPTANAKRKLSERSAAAILQKYLEKALPPRGLSLACVTLLEEEGSRGYYEYAVQERHGGPCPGDPSTSPIIDRYRVPQVFTKIQRYDVVEDRWVPAP